MRASIRLIYLSLVCFTFLLLFGNTVIFSGTTSIGSSSTLIKLRYSSFSADTGEPTIPRELRSGETGGLRYYLVQFRGPVREEWKQRLIKSGHRVYGYIPDYCHIVASTEDITHLTMMEPHIQWVGRYHPVYKIASYLLSKDFYEDLHARKQTTISLKVQLFDGCDKTGIVSRIAGISGSHVKLSDPGIYHTDFVVDIPVIFAEMMVKQIASIEGVCWIEQRMQFRVFNNDSEWVGQSWDLTGHTTPVWENGIDGTGQIVCVCDTGLDADMCFYYDDVEGLPNDTVNTNQRKVISYYDWYGDGNWDTHGHGTHVAGTVGGDNFNRLHEHDSGDGNAHSCKFVIQDVGGSSNSLPGIPNDLNLLFEEAYDDGARLHTNSWGSSLNEYTTDSQDVDEFMWNNKDFSIFFAMGNDGPGNDTIGTPATAKDCVSVGATLPGTQADSMASFSSRGWTADGRIKPSVTAPGQSIQSARNDSNLSSFNCNLRYMSGTSMATPNTAGYGTLVRHYLTGGYYPRGVPTAGDEIVAPGAALIKALLINSARSMASANDVPARDQGWGRVLLDDALFFAGDDRNLILYEDDPGLNTGDYREYTFSVKPSSEPLKVTLVWTDYPSELSASENLVNNLDLTLVTPGDTFIGNVYDSGESTTGGTTDTLNVVENVFITSPLEGAYTARVDATNIPEGPQPFAIVITGAFNLSVGTVALDRTYYNCSDSINIEVIDADLAGGAPFNVSIMSDTEPAGETVMLLETPADSGIFTGSIPAGAGPAATDGVLQVADSDTVMVTYIDASDGHGGIDIPVQDTALVDCVLPVISNVQISNITADSAVVTWNTDTLTDSTVYYDPSIPPVSLESSPIMVYSHSITITGLSSCTEYFVYVESTDSAMNTATDDNGGSYYTFTTLQREYSLVDDFESGPGDWTHGAAPLKIDSWALGVPVSGPGAAYSPSNCWATGLDTDYPAGTDCWLESPELFLVTGSSPQMIFWHYYEINGDNTPDSYNDGAWVEISTDHGRSFNLIAPVGDYPDRIDNDNPYLSDGGKVYAGTTADWEQAIFNLDAYDGNPVIFRFHIWQDEAEGNPTGAGWYVDDLQISEILDCEQGIIRIFRDTYKCEDTLKIVVIDGDLNTDPDIQETVDIEVWSDTETTPEILTLTEKNSSSWRFTNTMDISATDAPGVLQVFDSDIIYAKYTDANDGHGGIDVEVTDTAVTDCSGPVISGVSATNITENSAVIVWTTNESADSMVYYEDVAPPSLTKYDSGLSTSHSMQLTGLNECTTYYFSVESTDILDNSTLDDNGGLYYSFKTLGRDYIYTVDFEPSDGGYTHVAFPQGVDDWEYGIPTTGPSSAYSGDNCWATKLDAEYSDYSDCLLQTPAIDIRFSDNPYLTFMHYYDIHSEYSSGGDGAWVEISSDNGLTWDYVAPLTGYSSRIDPNNPYLPSLEDVYAGTTTDWQLARFDLSAYKDSIITIRFRLWRDVPENGSKGAGWYLDDIKIYDRTKCSKGAVTILGDVFGCESTVGFVVRDLDMNTDPGSLETLDISVTSTTESTPETVTLTEITISSWRFYGQIDISQIDSPGVLQVTHGDTITAAYTDPDDGEGGINVDATDVAGVDCIVPVISNVSVINVTDTSADITWDTNENADSIVCYAIVFPFTCDNNPAPVTAHTLHLAGLEPCSDYYFYVKSKDEAGNTAIDDNSGTFYVFRTKERLVIFMDDMEEPRTDEWTHAETYGSDDWQRGQVYGEGWDPYFVPSGTAIWGTDLGDTTPSNDPDGLYAHNSSQYLLSPVIDCTGYEDVQLGYWRWLTVEEGVYDNAVIYVKDNMVWENAASGDHLDNQWVYQVLDVSDYADNISDVQIKFELVSDPGKRFGGWNIDDVQLYQLRECAYPTFTPTITPTFTETLTPTYSPTPTITPSDTMTLTPTETPAFSATPTQTRTSTATATPTYTPSWTPTLTPSLTPSTTPSLTPSFTASLTPSLTHSSTPTLTSSFSPTQSPTYTVTSTFTFTVTRIPTHSPTPEQTPQIPSESHALILVLCIILGVAILIRGSGSIRSYLD